MKNKIGILFVGKPSFHLHEAICLALYLDAPIAFTDDTSYNIAEKFRDLIKLSQISESFSPGMFISGFETVYTNLQPVEFSPFIQIKFVPQKLKVIHIFEEHFSFLVSPKNVTFCSSLPHIKNKIPENCVFENLGNIGFLSFKKHQKALIKLAEFELSKNNTKRLNVLDLTIDCKDRIFNDEQSLDQIHFYKSSMCGFDNNNDTIAMHGLLDALIEKTNAIILNDETLSPLVLFHKKPFFVKEHTSGFYQSINPLVVKLPQATQNLVPLIDHYFDFETIDRENISNNLKKELYKDSIFA